MENLVSRQAAIEAWCKADCGCKREECHLTYERDGADACAVVRFLQERPAVEPKRGKWEKVDDWDGDCHYKCTFCGEEWFLIEGTPNENNMNYCPNCGAKMERSEDGET